MPREQYYTIFVKVPVKSASEARRLLHLTLAEKNITIEAIERGQGIDTK